MIIMKKRLCFCETNGYNMVVSVDSENNCRYLTETEEFPYIARMDSEQKEQAAKEFLQGVEDDGSWEYDCEYGQIFVDGVDIIAEIEKEL